MNREKESDSDYIRKWAKKIKAIRMLGSKCVKCGNLDTFALAFHHINAEEKEAKINNLWTYRWSIIEKEVSKCQLLCNNCHEEFHFLLNKNGLDESRHYQLKLDLLKYKGVSCCQECGFRGNSVSSLDFHHACSAQEKLFAVREIRCGGKRKGEKWNSEYIYKEIDKCSVLCKNCHVKKRIQIERFNKFRDQIFEMVDNIIERPKTIDRNIIADMYINKKMTQSEIRKKLGCAKSTISMAIKNLMFER